jgi:trk system potassium uptake protein
MYLILVGIGTIGYYVAQILSKEEHDVVIIEKDPKRAQQISEELDLVAIQGDGTETGVLEKAGIREADAVISLTSSDETNMVVSIMAKELGAKKVAARIGKIEYDENVLKKLGIDIIIHPEAATAGYITELITKPGVLNLAFLSRGEAEILEVEVKPNSKIVGKKISEIEQPSGSAIVATTKNGKFCITHPETTIEPGEQLFIITNIESSKKVRELLK